MPTPIRLLAGASEKKHTCRGTRITQESQQPQFCLVLSMHVAVTVEKFCTA